MSSYSGAATAPPIKLHTARDVVRTQRDFLWNAKGLAARLQLPTSALVVLNKLVIHADAAGRTTVRAKRIAKDTGLSERTVRTALTQLRECGLLSIVRVTTRTGWANEYWVHPPKAAAGKGRATGAEGEGTESPSPSDEATPSTRVLPVSASDDGRASLCAETGLDDAPAAPANEVNVPAKPEEGLCISCRTPSATIAEPPRVYPSSERIQINDPPISPPEGGGSHGVDETPRERTASEDEAIVTRVLEHFVATLWPTNVGPPVDRHRRRLVLGRLRELRRGKPHEDAEQVLRDAVVGAKFHPWHREAEHRKQARFVFRDLDKVEELARFGRARRLAETRERPMKVALYPSAARVAPPRSVQLPSDAPQWMKEAFGIAS